LLPYNRSKDKQSGPYLELAYGHHTGIDTYRCIFSVNLQINDKIMKKKMGFILLAIALMGLTSCVTTHVASIQPVNEEDIAVFTTTKPAGEYTELKYIQAEGSIFHKPEKLLQKLRQRAKEEGADAIIDVRYGYQFWWPYVEGTAVKY